MADKEEVQVRLIVANATKINPEDRLIVIIPGQDLHWIDEIYDALQDLTGHTKHFVIPVSKPEAVKFYAIKGENKMHINVDPDLT